MALSERLFAAGLEQLSGTVVEIRADAKGRIDQLEQRLASAEKAARFNTDALDHALEKIELWANQRALDQVESQRRTAHVEQRCNGLEDSLARLEMSRLDTGLTRRLEDIEQVLVASAERLKGEDPATKLGASLQALSHRLESLEANHKYLLEELRVKFLRPAEPPAVEPPPVVVEAAIEPPDFSPETAFEPDGDPVEYATVAGPDFADIFAQPEEAPENFLAQARRAARVAPEKSKPRYLFPVLVGLLALLALAAGLALNGRMKEQAAVQRVGGPEMRTFSLPEPPASDSDNTEFVVAPQAGGQEKDSPDGGRKQAAPDPAHNGISSGRILQMANAGNPIALAILGLRALDGTDGVAVNLSDAVKFLTQAAEKGHAVAQYRLGTLYEHGKGVPADAAKAAHWYEMAANQGNRKAMHNLAVFDAGGVVGKKNMAEAANWFAKAAVLGLSDSQFNLAVLYERGDGVPQSLLDAYKWYAIAAAAGDSESKARLAVLQTQLGDADKAAANKSVASFHAAPLNRSANAPPQSGDLDRG